MQMTGSVFNGGSKVYPGNGHILDSWSVMFLYWSSAAGEVLLRQSSHIHEKSHQREHIVEVQQRKMIAPEGLGKHIFPRPGL